MSITNLDLNLMLVLHTVLAERNVARAAERLHVTPSAVSNSLARLRDLLGDPLVTRKGRGIVPTPRALELAPGIARGIRELEATLLAAPFDAASCTRTFTLAVADLGQITWVPRLARALAAAMPRAQLRVIGVDALVALGDLGAAEVDVQVGIAPKLPGVHFEPLYEEKSVLVARARHPLAKKKLTRASLSTLRHVRVEMVPGKAMRDPFAPLFERAGAERVVTVTVPSFTAAAEVVAASDLVTMLPISFWGRRKKSLIGLRTPLPIHTIPLSLCWHERTHTDAAARAFRELVKAVVLRARD